MKKQIKEVAYKIGEPEEQAEFIIRAYMKDKEVEWDDAVRHWLGKDIKIVSLKEASEKVAQTQKIACGMQELDEAMGGGITPGSSIVVAAPPGQGKTSFLVTLSFHFLKQGVPCLWFSYEENISAIWDRFKLTGIEDATPAFCPLDLSDNKINFIEDVIRQFKKENEFFVVFIDQLYELAPKVLTERVDINRIQSNYALYLGMMSTQLKEIANKHQIIVVVAHQLGRSGDLAYSDAVKHAPDKVVYLVREPNLDKNATEEFTDTTWLLFKKNRPFGSRPKIPMTVEKGVFVKKENHPDKLLKYAESLGWRQTND